MINAIRRIETKINAHEEDFIRMFAPNGTMEVVKLSFSSERIYFTVLLEQGQHVSTSTTYDVLGKWLSHFAR
jgi:hypothetical protein